MKKFDQIEYVLANYFSVDREFSEEEAVELLKSYLASDPQFAENLREQLQASFKAPNFSWQDALQRNEVLTMNDESDAKIYAKKIFADAIRVEVF